MKLANLAYVWEIPSKVYRENIFVNYCTCLFLHFGTLLPHFPTDDAYFIEFKVTTYQQLVAQINCRLQVRITKERGTQ